MTDKKFLRELLTGNDNATFDAVRVLAVLSIVVALGLAVFVVVAKGQPFSVQDFGIGIGAVFLSVGAALKLKGDPTEVETKTALDVADPLKATA